ncbi:MAG: CRISPR-associated endonuclease Cas3'', partial [Spirochaetaceae bacterium]|nr:CRISPR-associated endonuclease Cas3'' [Spirochaetaceae bacterium]
MNESTKQRLDELYRYWGKASWTEAHDLPGTYHLLVYHSLDVAAVAHTLLQPNQRRCTDIATRIGLSPLLVRYLITLAMMMHDFGKFSKAFQSLVPDLYRQLFLRNKPKLYNERHDTLGFVLWRGAPGAVSKSLKSALDAWNPHLRELLEPIIRASFGHHGLPPKESAQGGSVILRASSFFDVDDLAIAQGFLSDCLDILGDPPEMPAETKSYRKGLKQISWTIAGLATLTDWIGSNADFFPYVSRPIELASYWRDVALPEAERALSHVEWRSHRPARFSSISTVGSLFPSIGAPTPLQQCSADMSISNDPQLLILEDVTGSGKTEAAMVLAARI